MIMFSKIKLIKFKKIAAISCVVLLCLLLFSPLIFLSISKLNRMDNKWIFEGVSSVFEKKEYSFYNTFDLIQEIVIDNEETITIFGTSVPSLEKKGRPIALQSRNGGKNWNVLKIDLDLGVVRYKHIGDRMFLVSHLKIGDIVSYPVYMSDGNFKKWEKVENANLYDNKVSANLLEYCQGGGIKLSQNDRDWLVCGYDDELTSIHEVRILHKEKDEFSVQGSFKNKWHIWRTKHMNPSDFYVKDDLMVGLFDFQMTAGTLLHYLYYSIDGGKTWRNEKIPFFSLERLYVSENKIVVFGLSSFYGESRVKATILTMPIPKK